MSVNEILSGGFILPQFINDAAIVVPIANVTNLQASLNSLQSQINAIPANNAAEFYALMPSDNASTVAVGAAVLFPQNGPTTGLVTRSSTSQFILPSAGTYEVAFQVSVTEAGQLGVAIGGTLVAKTVVGRTTGTSQIVYHGLITTGAANSLLSVINPVGNSAALTITTTAGGASAVSANLVIKQIA